MTIRQQVLELLYSGADPFLGFPRNLYQTDTQGWHSQHPYLASAIDTASPKIIVEIGVWKGGSTLFMADHIRKLGLDAVVIAVDTWLGSWDHWIVPALRQELNFIHGYPNFYYKFLNNVKMLGLEEYVVPLPLDSLNAFHTLRHFKITPDIVHIDAGHDYRAVKSDIEIWWPQIRPGGILIGDDYTPGVWPEVCTAFNQLAQALGQDQVEHFENKCIFRKPAAAAA